MTSPGRITDRFCGPTGCEVDWLTSERHEATDEHGDAIRARLKAETDAR